MSQRYLFMVPFPISQFSFWPSISITVWLPLLQSRWPTVRFASWLFEISLDFAIKALFVACQTLTGLSLVSVIFWFCFCTSMNSYPIFTHHCGFYCPLARVSSLSSIFASKTKIFPPPLLLLWNTDVFSLPSMNSRISGHDSAKYVITRKEMCKES